MHDEALKMATQQIMRTRVEMMLEYHRGEQSSWDIAETVKIYNVAYPDDAFSVNGLGGNDVEAKSPKEVPKTMNEAYFVWLFVKEVYFNR